MRIISIIMFFSLFLFSCGGKNETEVKSEIKNKVLYSLKCDSNSDILNVSVSSCNISKNSIDFSGTYKAKFEIKYDGTFNGYATIEGDNVEIKSLNYENPLANNSVSESCFD